MAAFFGFNPTTVLLFRNYTGEAAFRISFLMSIPAVFAAAAGLIFIDGLPTVNNEILYALLSSFVTSLLTINILLKAAQRIKLWGLCIILGLIALLPQLTNIIL